MLQITICPSCSIGNIKKVRRNWKGNFKGQSYTVPSLEFYECSNCGERIYERQAMQKIEAVSPVFTKPHIEKKVQAMNND